jgi:hypothetical protein
MNLGGKMDKLVEFLKNNDTLQCKKDNLILEEDIEKYEKKLNFNFGKELKKYILEYGFLAFKFVEFYGINKKQEFDSDMVKDTLKLNEQFSETKSLIAFENKGDEDYIFLDSDDNVYEFDTNLDDGVVALQKKLFEYILERFKEIDYVY